MMLLVATSLALQPASWPPCDDEDIQTATDCVLSTDDSVGWLVGFDFTPDAAPDSVQVIVSAADGIPFQTVDIALDREMRTLTPTARDLDGDGFDDVLLSQASEGVVNADWSLLFGDFDGFWQADILPNVHTLTTVEPGLFYAQARSASWQQFGRFYTRDGASLIEQAVIAIEFDDEDQSVCRLERAVDDRGEEFYCNAVLIN